MPKKMPKSSSTSLKKMTCGKVKEESRIDEYIIYLLSTCTIILIYFFFIILYM